MKKLLGLVVVAGLGVSGCADPYDPGQRALGGAGIGAAGGALIGGALGGGRGAVTGAVLGGAGGALTGAATAPQRSYYGGGQPSYGGQPYYGGGQPVYQEAPPVYSRRYGY